MKMKLIGENIKKEWQKPQMIQLNVKKTASGTGNKWETHPHSPRS